jgi:hypothetical protein
LFHCLSNKTIKRHCEPICSRNKKY